MIGKLLRCPFACYDRCLFIDQPLSAVSADEGKTHTDARTQFAATSSCEIPRQDHVREKVSTVPPHASLIFFAHLRWELASRVGEASRWKRSTWPARTHTRLLRGGRFHWCRSAFTWKHRPPLQLPAVVRFRERCPNCGRKFPHSLRARSALRAPHSTPCVGYTYCRHNVQLIGQEQG